MFFHAKMRSKHVDFLTTLSVFFLLMPLSAKAEIGLRFHARRTPFLVLAFTQKTPPYSIGYPSRLLPVLYPNSFRPSFSFSPTGPFITTSLQMADWSVLTPRYFSFEEYIAERSHLEAVYSWRDYNRKHVSPMQDRSQAGRGITIESPKIRSEAFRRVFGGETVSLNVKGNITIDGGMRHEKPSYIKSAVSRRPNTNFQMKQTQRFIIEGKIGENVSVLVNQDSERAFDFENAIKLQYSSDEDGIIKSIEAGNVGLSLPSTRFVTFSAQNSGLFGFKTAIRVGRLDITAIASMEKGEKKRKTLTGGKEEQTYQIQDYEYKKATYFFLDYYYRNRYPQLDANGNHTYHPDSSIAEIEVYKSDYNYQNKPDAFPAWAVINPNNADTTFKSQENYKGDFIRLDPSEYYINLQLGFIAMDMPLQESEVLAVAYRTAAGAQHGTLRAFKTDTSAVDIFKLIKPQTARPSDQTWNLEWKNVYNLGGRDIQKEGFDLKIFYKPPSGDPQQALTVGNTTYGYLNVFGLDKKDEVGEPNPDDVIDIDNNILSLSRGELIFLDLRPFDPEGTSLLPEDKRTRAIYDTTNTSYIRQQSKFYMDVKSSKRSPNYFLGMNVIPGTEEVLLNNVPLKKDTDYHIDYLSGTLTVLNEEATNPNAKLEISYESQQLFSIDKKSLMGARAEYTLWEDGANRSFIGTTLLYLSQRILEKRIRLGRDAPMKNLVWDVNAALRFRPNFITKALDALPLIEATAPSSISIEGEIAQILPNPNTLNNSSTGDNDGVAYFDDFESAKREVQLGVIRSVWNPSSPPATADSAMAYLGKRGHLFWYNPYNQIPIQDIWPDREVTTNFGGTTQMNVLTMEFIPTDTLKNLAKSWGGIQQSLSAGYANQTDSRFLEVWVNGKHGRIHVDLGRISEDVIPNQQLNTEDKRRGGFREGTLTDDEDTGLDGVFGPDPPDLFHPHEFASINNGVANPYDFWDVDGDSIKDPNEPWSYDNWQYEAGGDPFYINGTENNKKDGMAIYPNTEDINNNGDVDLNNDYFEYVFSLEENHPDTVYIAGGRGNPKGWLLYRIPLDRPTKVVGTPDWSRIEYVRIWIDDMDQPTALSIAQITLAGNEWKLRGVAAAGDSLFTTSNDSTMTIAVINTHDNPEYTPPKGVEGEIDPIQRIQSKEQSLVIRMNDLDAGATAIAQKELYQSENLIYYQTMRMFVHGGDVYNDIPADSSIEFFLRWGSDTKNSHYYEVRLPVFPGWDERNNIEVQFEDLSRLKLQMQTTLSDTISEIQANGHRLSIVGAPSLTNIRWLIIGLKNKSNTPFTGQVWIDELRLSKVRKDKGMAMRARMDIAFSDFATLNGEFNRRDADFHTINERFGSGSNTLGGTVSTSIQLHKLLPTEWGLIIPVSANFSKSRQTPKYLPGSDILVNKNTVPSDSLRETIESRTENKGLNFSISKQTKSRNFFTRYFIDPIRTSFSYTQSNMSSSQIKYSRNTGYTGSFGYDLSFGNQYFWEPFQWLGKDGIFRQLAKAKLYYLPSKLSLTANGNDLNKNSETRAGVASNVYTANFSRTFSSSLNPFTILNLTYTSIQTSDIRQSRWIDLLTSLNPGDPLSQNQQVGTNFTPKFFSWLTHTFRYSTDYRWTDNPQMRAQGTNRSASLTARSTFNGSFDPQKFVQLFRKKDSQPARMTRRPVTRARPDTTAGQQSDQQQPEKKKLFSLLSVLSFMGNAIDKIDPISIDISDSRSENLYGILGTPSLAYRLGLADSAGVRTSPNVTQRSSTRKDNSVTFRSGLKISRQLTFRFDYQYSTSENRTTQVTGNIQKYVFMWKGKDFPFPGWTIQWRGLEKLPFISYVARSISLTHTFSGKRTDTWNEFRENVTQSTISKDFRPLIGVSLDFKNNMNANIQYTTSETIQENKKYSQGRTKRVSSTLNITAKYDMKGGIKLPFFKKKLENNINFSLSFTKSVNSTSQTREAKGDYTEMARTENWSFQPRITYTFTRNVSGGINFELGERKDLRIGNTKIMAFGLNANISLAGG